MKKLKSPLRKSLLSQILSVNLGTGQTIALYAWSTVRISAFLILLSRVIQLHFPPELSSSTQSGVCIEHLLWRRTIWQCHYYLRSLHRPSVGSNPGWHPPGHTPLTLLQTSPCEQFPHVDMQSNPYEPSEQAGNRETKNRQQTAVIAFSHIWTRFLWRLVVKCIWIIYSVPPILML